MKPGLLEFSISHPEPKSLTGQGQAVFLHRVGGSGDEVGDLILVDVVG